VQQVILLVYYLRNFRKNKKYGAKIEYNEAFDALVLGTFQNYTANNAIYINRVYGNVGLGGLNNGSVYKLYVYGRAYNTYGTWEASDRRYKEDIKDITIEASKLKQLKGVSYKKKVSVPEFFNQSNDSLKLLSKQPSIDTTKYNKTDSGKYPKPIVPERSYGFIAQDVQKIFPDLVIQDENGYLAINYTGFIPMIVESYKEQQSTLDSLKENNVKKDVEIKNLNLQMEDLKARIEKLELQLKDCCSGVKKNTTKSYQIVTSTPTGQIDNELKLYQNTPNPFTQNTVINYYLPEGTQNAMICIYDMNGVQLKCTQLYNKGNSSISINGSELKAGMYMYSLIADGQLVDTKRMVLTN
jgi:hypothetical protein